MAAGGNGGEGGGRVVKNESVEEEWPIGGGSVVKNEKEEEVGDEECLHGKKPWNGDEPGRNGDDGPGGGVGVVPPIRRLASLGMLQGDSQPLLDVSVWCLCISGFV